MDAVREKKCTQLRAAQYFDVKQSILSKLLSGQKRLDDLGCYEGRAKVTRVQAATLIHQVAEGNKAMKDIDAVRVGELINEYSGVLNRGLRSSSRPSAVDSAKMEYNNLARRLPRKLLKSKKPEKVSKSALNSISPVTVFCTLHFFAVYIGRIMREGSLISTEMQNNANFPSKNIVFWDEVACIYKDECILRVISRSNVKAYSAPLGGGRKKYR